MRVQSFNNFTENKKSPAFEQLLDRKTFKSSVDLLRLKDCTYQVEPKRATTKLSELFQGYVKRMNEYLFRKYDYKTGSNGRIEGFLDKDTLISVSKPKDKAELAYKETLKQADGSTKVFAIKYNYDEANKMVVRDTTTTLSKDDKVISHEGIRESLKTGDRRFQHKMVITA